MAKPLLPDELWVLIQPLIPPHPPQPEGQQFPACGFRPENTLVLISHFANSLRTMLSRIPYLTAWANGVTRHGTCFR